jgi:hypothetical protein
LLCKRRAGSLYNKNILLKRYVHRLRRDRDRWRILYLRCKRRRVKRYF